MGLFTKKSKKIKQMRFQLKRTDMRLMELYKRNLPGLMTNDII